MVECTSFQCFRRLLILINIFYIILASFFIYFAIYNRLTATIVNLHLFIGLIVLGIFLFILAVVGIFAVLEHHQVFLFFYTILLGILFITQFILACTFLTLGTRADFNRLKDGYQHSSTKIQLKYNCCEFENTTKSDRFAQCRNLSCCLSSSDCCPNLPFCDKLLKAEVDHSSKIAGTIMLISTLIQVICIWMTYRFRNIRNPAIFTS